MAADNHQTKASGNYPAGRESLMPTRHEEIINSLATSWEDQGLPRPLASSSFGHVTCEVEDCNSINFAQVKAGERPTAVCLKHFQAMESVIRSRHPRRPRRNR